MITISEYTNLFLTIIAGLGIVFEMPVLVFFLALMGIVTAGWMWRNFRYAILVMFIIAAIITPDHRHHEHVRLRRTHDRAVPVQHRHRLVRTSGAKKRSGQGRLASKSARRCG